MGLLIANARGVEDNRPESSRAKVVSIPELYSEWLSCRVRRFVARLGVSRYDAIAMLEGKVYLALVSST